MDIKEPQNAPNPQKVVSARSAGSVVQAGGGASGFNRQPFGAA
jgi:hypothetical protein